MKIKICNILLIITLMAFTVSVSAAQNNSMKQSDSAAIRSSVMDYIEGFYSGDVVRMEKAVHPDINKATPRDLPQTGRTILNYTTYSGLIELTRAKAGILHDTARHIRVHILNIDNDVANVKVTSANFTDYIQAVKLDSQWKIVNVMFTSGTSVPPRLKDFNAENERKSIEQTALEYLAGISGADAARLEMAISSDFSRITLNPIAPTGKTSLRRLRYESMLENTFAGIGKQDEIYRNNRVSILDITDGIAVVRCDQTGAYDFVQMYKSGKVWKIFNSISKRNASLTLEQALTAIVGNPMADFTLPVYNSKDFTLSKYRGKNVLLIFPRGWLGNVWCPYCPYQYLELEQLEKTSGIRSKNNLEIAFVMPYSSDRIKDWMEKFPDALGIVENTKNPVPAPPAGSLFGDYSAWARKNFPIKFESKKDDVHNIIPVLVDENRTLSRGIKIFTNFWDGVSSEQNMATVLIIDKNGILRFKYIGQMTEDRPSVEFLLDFIKKMK